jgi:hypothetical protein
MSKSISHDAFFNFDFCMKLSMDLRALLLLEKISSTVPHIMSWIGMFYKPLLTVKSILCCNL